MTKAAKPTLTCQRGERPAVGTGFAESYGQAPYHWGLVPFPVDGIPVPLDQGLPAGYRSGAYPAPSRFAGKPAGPAVLERRWETVVPASGTVYRYEERLRTGETAEAVSGGTV